VVLLSSSLFCLRLLCRTWEWSAERGAGSRELRAESWERRARSWQLEAETSELGARSREQGTLGSELGARSREQGAAIHVTKVSHSAEKQN